MKTQIMNELNDEYAKIILSNPIQFKLFGAEKALAILLFLGIIPGIIYYFLKSPVCPICKHSQWQIPHDEENS